MNNNTKYNKLYDQLENIKNNTIESLKKYGKTDSIQSILKRLEEDKKRNNIKVAFVGQYNAGKSTIISALTGYKDILIDSNVATNVIQEYNWKNIKIIDTPGILAGKVESHDEVTKAALAEADLIVYTLTSQLFDDVIFDNFIDLAYKQNFKNKMLIAINKMSMESGDFNTLKKNYIDSLKAVFREKQFDFNFDIVFIDAFDYLEGVDEDEPELIELSHFEKFTKKLDVFIKEKGLIQKSFDTPVRIIQEEIGMAALDESDPSFALVLRKYENRLTKHKKELVQEVKTINNELKDKIISKGYAITSMNEFTQEEFDQLQKEYQEYIEAESTTAMSVIESLIAEKQIELNRELTEVFNDDDVVVYTENLDVTIDKIKHTADFDDSSINSKKVLIDKLKAQAGSLSNYAGTSGSASFIAKAGEVAGSKGHKLVYETGKFFGKKFKPWEAVKLSGKIGNAAKFAGPALAVFSLGIDIYGAYKDEKKAKEISVAKTKMNSQYIEIANGVAKEVELKFQEYVKENIDSKLNDFQKQQMEIIDKEKKNSEFLNRISELNSEYVDFIELINE